MHISECPIGTIVEITEDFDEVQYSLLNKIPAHTRVCVLENPRGGEENYSDCLFAHKRFDFPKVLREDRYLLKKSGSYESKVVLASDDFTFKVVP